METKGWGAPGNLFDSVPLISRPLLCSTTCGVSVESLLPDRSSSHQGPPLPVEHRCHWWYTDRDVPWADYLSSFPVIARTVSSMDKTIIPEYAARCGFSRWPFVVWSLNLQTSYPCEAISHRWIPRAVSDRDCRTWPKRNLLSLAR